MQENEFSVADLEASWIWPAKQKNQVNQYVEFRHEFVLDAPAKDAELIISVDTNYVAWINGNFVDTGQFSDYPDKKTYDRLSIGQHLKKGKNVLAVLANYCGEDHFSYIKGDAGLIYAIRAEGLRIVSGEETRYRTCRCYRQPVFPSTTVDDELKVSCY